MKYSIFTMDSLDRFNAVEMWPVEECDGMCNQVNESEIGSNDNADYFWSVFLRHNPDHPENDEFGGADCVVDLPTKEAAEAFAHGLRIALASVIGWENIK